MDYYREHNLEVRAANSTALHHCLNGLAVKSGLAAAGTALSCVVVAATAIAFWMMASAAAAGILGQFSNWFCDTLCAVHHPTAWASSPHTPHLVLAGMCVAHLLCYFCLSLCSVVTLCPGAHCAHLQHLRPQDGAG